MAFARGIAGCWSVPADLAAGPLRCTGRYNHEWHAASNKAVV